MTNKRNPAQGRLPRLRRARPELLPGLVMQPRDMAILETVYEYRALTSEQIFRLLLLNVKYFCRRMSSREMSP